MTINPIFVSLYMALSVMALGAACSLSRPLFQRPHLRRGGDLLALFVAIWLIFGAAPSLWWAVVRHGMLDDHEWWRAMVMSPFAVVILSATIGLAFLQIVKATWAAQGWWPAAVWFAVAGVAGYWANPILHFLLTASGL